MSLSLKERKAVAREDAAIYHKATKKEKGHILDEFVRLTGYSRCYASYVLRAYGKKVVVNSSDRIKTVFIGDDLHNGRGMKVRRRKRERTYDESVVNALIYLWKTSDYLCGKRLVVCIREIIPVLNRLNEFRIDEEVKEKLRRTYEELNPFALKGLIDKVTQELSRVYEKKTKGKEKKIQKVDEKSYKDFPLTKNDFV